MDTQEKITRGVPLLDSVVPQYLKMQRVPKKDTRQLFLRMFHDLPDKLIHLENSWLGKKKNFDVWYMNLDAQCDRKVLEYFGFQVEADRLPDIYAPDAEEDNWKKRFVAIQNAKDGFDIFPFQTHILFQFLQMAYNNCPDILRKWGMEEQLRKSKIKEYGNGNNWGRLYQYLLQRGDREGRERIVRFTVTRNQKKENDSCSNIF